MGITKKIIIPKEKSLEEILNSVYEDKDIKKFLEKQPLEKRATYLALLQECVRERYYQFHNLIKFGKYVDTIDRSLVPIDALADYLAIFLGFPGEGISILKELIEMPIKFLYDLYYVGKTKHIGEAFKDALYELGSWFIPGSVLDLTNRYLRRAEREVINYAKKDFFKKVYEKTREEKVKKTKIKEKEMIGVP